MNKLHLLYIVASLGFAQAQLCPPADVVSPCTCDETNREISCRELRGLWNIKAHFDNISQHVNDSVVFNSLKITGCSNIFEIPSGAISTLKFLEVDISMNPNLQSISPDAFNATYQVTTSLDMWNNYLLDTVAPRERQVYDFVSKFEKLESVWIPTSSLTSIPDNAFGYLPNLEDLYLGSNDISSIGANAFAQLPKLKNLWMSHNNLPADSLNPDAFKGISSTVDKVDLTYNTEMTHIGEAFKPLFDAASGIQVGGSRCSPTSGCTYQRLQCDERADWICSNVNLYQPKVFGFRCTQLYANVWEYCGNRTLNF